MSEHISFDYSQALEFVSQEEIDALEPEIRKAHQHLHLKTGAGAQFLGWVDLPSRYDKKEFARIKKAAAQIRETSDALIIVGIGGSYLGSKAALDMLTHSFYNQLPRRLRGGPEIYFAGQHLSSAYVLHLQQMLESKDFSINVISKSGTTTEPAIAFRMLTQLLEQKYGKSEAKKRIYVTTDQSKGVLKTIADTEGYESFVIPDDIGGRYSVLTAVGLLPLAVAGIDVDAVMTGAQDAASSFANPELTENSCYQYAAVRNMLYRQGKAIEILVHYEPSFRYFAEWWKQLFGESEGKELKGIFPASAQFSTDLHSMGQYIQEGVRHLFETVLQVQQTDATVMLGHQEDDRDGLNFLAGKSLDLVNKKAFEGTLLAHTDGQVPNLIISIPQSTPYWFGYLVYFFEKACGISGHVLGVNPFNQPGVEAYKRNMFALLGKPGFDKEKENLEKRLGKHL